MEITIENSSKQKIFGTLSDPGSKYAVLMCHGLGGNKDSIIFTTFQDKINALGYATLRIDMLGHGKSQGHYEDLNLSEATDDVEKAFDALKKRGFENIGFIGHSFGAVAGIMAKRDFSFRVLISPPSHYDVKEIFISGYHLMKELRKFWGKKESLNDKRKAGLTVRFFRDYATQDSYVAAAKIKCPVLIIHGENDKIVPLEKSKELSKLMKRSKIKIFKDTGHHYSSLESRKRLFDETMKFISSMQP